MGTAAPGCPAERSSAVLRLDAEMTQHWRALLARTAEGGCPHVIVGEKGFYFPHQTTSIGYFSKTRFEVSTTIFSTIAWAMIIRSKGSKW